MAKKEKRNNRIATYAILNPNERLQYQSFSVFL